ncbi:MAG: GNAT family N-acetyltransferase [Bacteroidota bacterium]
MDNMTTFNPDNSCFELFVYGDRAYIECKLKDDVIYMIHTIVPESLRGNKIGEMLVQEALDICKNKDWKVVPLCPFVLVYLKEHEEYQFLVREKDREKYFG